MKLGNVRGLNLLVMPIVFLSASASALNIKFDYRYDSAGFFNDPIRRDILSLAAAEYGNRITDSLSPVVTTNVLQGVNCYGCRDAYLGGGSQISLGELTSRDVSIGKDELLIFVGAKNLNPPIDDRGVTIKSLEAGKTLAQGSAGGYYFHASGYDGAWMKAGDYISLWSRGQQNVVGVDGGQLIQSGNDFAPWGGNISFDENTDWHFSNNTADKMPFSGYDFYSVALHEIGHVLGVGSAPSWTKKVIDQGGVYQFIGSNSVAENGGQSIVLDGHAEHFGDGVMSFSGGSGQSPLMGESILEGQRKKLTKLDYAALRDVGWEVSPVPEPDTWVMIAIGLGVVTFSARKRTNK